MGGRRDLHTSHQNISDDGTEIYEKRKYIKIQGAREHNLQNIDIELPKGKLIVFTGVSGSGKSSLAIDTIYAEGQRRYIESLSAYARQFLGQLAKPEVDKIIGLAPSIAIDQGSTAHNPRSTVATVTEIYDYLRVLFARVGKFHCPECGEPVGSQTGADIAAHILNFPARTRLLILAPIIRARRGTHNKELDDARKAGFVRARIDGEMHEIGTELRLNPNQRHDIDIVVDRLILKHANRETTSAIESRVAEAVETALNIGDGNLIVHIMPPKDENVNQNRERIWVGGRRDLHTNQQNISDDGTEIYEKSDLRGRDELFSTAYACAQCQASYEIPEPRHFSFNTPQGMCPECTGLGTLMGISPALIIPDETLSIPQGAITLWGKLDAQHLVILRTLAKHLKFNINTPWKELSPEQQHAILYGTGDTVLSFSRPSQGSHKRRRYRGRFQGVIPAHEEQYASIQEESLPDFFAKMPCRACNGSRLNPRVSTITLNGKAITDVLQMSIEEAAPFFETLQLPEREAFIAAELLKEIRGRLKFLMDVGLGYLTLSRSAPTLSGGEAQRIRLASQVGAGLRDVIYVLDEPSIGLHPRDHAGLLTTLSKLRDQGNTVIVVEHDEATMLIADWIVDFGPKAGVQGGQITAMGTPAQILKESDSLTAQYLRGDKQIVKNESRRTTGTRWVHIRDACQNNLKSISPKIPIGTFCCVTGVSGSGKSSLVHDIVYNALARDLMRAKTVPGAYRDIQGIIDGKTVPISDVIDKIINIDMAPIGRTPRSNPATYTKVFDAIRSFYAGLPESKWRGYKPGRFSFNVPGGRCEVCKGNGAKQVDMGVLADVWVACDVCEGRRYNSETLTVKYKQKSIADVLEMDVDVALAHFADIPKIARTLQLLHDVGLDYIKLGQPAPTLSGGEAQRIKLARELSKRSTGKTFYLLDEPTTGLHFDDVNKLLRILHRLVDAGNTVLVVEHNLEVINSADYLLDLGPEGGANGGTIVAVGTPEQLAQVPDSYTGQALRGEFEKSGSPPNQNINIDGTEIDEKDENMITVRGAEQNNLKQIDIDIPHLTLTAFTGVSGSGKTSLALDTLYAEGQRRYIETLNTYARQFIGQMEKPKVKSIDGLSPAIAISHDSPSQNPRSTVATITDIHDRLRSLYARWGVPHCPNCLEAVQPQTAEQIATSVFESMHQQRIDVLAPMTHFAGGTRIERLLKGNENFIDAFRRLQKAGFVRALINGKMHRLDEAPKLDKRRHHEIFLVIDRLELVDEEKSRLAEAVELALLQSEGFICFQKVQERNRSTSRGKPPMRYFFSEDAMCTSCGENFPQLTPRHFSFNNKIGACTECDGRGHSPIAGSHKVCSACEGTRLQPFPSVVMFSDKTIAELMALSITEIISFFTRRIRQINMNLNRENLSGDATEIYEKQGQPLTGPATSRATHTTLHGYTSPEFEAELLSQTVRRLQFLEDIGLGYLELDRPAPTLSGGEIRRIRLASQLGSGLTGVTYILDEPSIGLHPRDQERLISAMKSLRDIGNNVLVVEHDRNTILAADHIIDFGPGAGEHGGEIVAIGTPHAFSQETSFSISQHNKGSCSVQPTTNLVGGSRCLDSNSNGSGEICTTDSKTSDVDGLKDTKERDLHTSHQNISDDGTEIYEKTSTVDRADIYEKADTVENGAKKVGTSLTHAYLSNAKQIQVPSVRRKGNGKWLELLGARTNNLKDIDVKMPLGTLICVTGVSGSGKSSLVDGTLRPALSCIPQHITSDVMNLNIEGLRRDLHTSHQNKRDDGTEIDEKPNYQRIKGASNIRRLINVDGKPIGETPRSNPATYTEVFTHIRELFATLPDAKVRGFNISRFSFNLNYGQCPDCDGHRYLRIEMHFLPDVWVPCETCGSTGYNAETLSVRYKGKNIAEVLQLTVQEALHLFRDIKKIQHPLQTLADVGLEYIQLGQSAPTLSCGEAQRIKLAKELSRRHAAETLYIMDEPTTGLHFEDVQKLLKVLNRLVDAGNTIIAVEHNMDVIKSADWILDLGPEGSKGGGYLVASGTPEEVSTVHDSHTAQFLRRELFSSTAARHH